MSDYTSWKSNPEHAQFWGSLRNLENALKGLEILYRVKIMLQMHSWPAICILKSWNYPFYLNSWEFRYWNGVFRFLRENTPHSVYGGVDCVWDRHLTFSSSQFLFRKTILSKLTLLTSRLRSLNTLQIFNLGPQNGLEEGFPNLCPTTQSTPLCDLFHVTSGLY